MGKSLLTKLTMDKSPNEMGNCPFAPPFARPLRTENMLCHIQSASFQKPSTYVRYFKLILHAEINLLSKSLKASSNRTRNA